MGQRDFAKVISDFFRKGLGKSNFSTPTSIYRETALQNYGLHEVNGTSLEDSISFFSGYHISECHKPTGVYIQWQ